MGKAVEKLEQDPCASGAYKPIGPLHDRVCALHMSGEWRLVFTFVKDGQDPEGEGRDVVAVLAIGKKKPLKKEGIPAALELVHEVLGEDFGPGTRDRIPCCQEPPSSMTQDDIDDAMAALRKLLRRWP